MLTTIKGSLFPSVTYKLAKMVYWILQKNIDTTSIPSTKQNISKVVCFFKTPFYHNAYRLSVSTNRHS